MGRPNFFQVAKAIYKAVPATSDYRMKNVIYMIFDVTPTDKTLSVWKSRLRKAGINIPKETDATS